jgi:hypothetical protein
LYDVVDPPASAVEVDLLLRRPNRLGRRSADLLRPTKRGREDLVCFDRLGDDVRLEDVLRDWTTGEEVGSELGRVVDGAGDATDCSADTDDDLREGDLDTLAGDDDVYERRKSASTTTKRREKGRTAVGDDLSASTVGVAVESDDEGLLGATASERTEAVDVGDQLCIGRFGRSRRRKPILEVLLDDALVSA